MNYFFYIFLLTIKRYDSKMLTVVNKGDAMISKATEEYLKTIYVLLKQKSKVRVTDIANKMNCSKPSVTKQLSILKEHNFINYETYGHIELSKEGIDYARKILADYDILYILLHDVIGVDSDLSKIEASKIKGVIDEKTLSKISSYIYEVMDLKQLKCNFNIRRESCRECLLKKGISKNDRAS